MKKSFLILIIAIFFSNPAWSKAERSINLNEVSIPKEFGSVKELYQSPVTGKRASKIIFHIQDVHANYQAQKNLANILEYLIETYGLDLILVEGGITDKDFSYIRGWGPLEERKRNAEELLKEGIITGETYVDIATNFPLKFQGIEDKSLYEENMEIYLKVDTFREEGLKVICDFKNAVERLKKFIYTRRLKEFDKYNQGYRNLEEIGLVEYLEYLNDISSKEEASLKIYPNQAILLKTAHLEKMIDFDKVEKERDDLIKSLDGVLPKQNFNKLLVMSIKFKEGRISDGEFYSYLRQLSIQNKIDMDKYRDLDKYIDYIKTYEGLESEELFKEINKIEDLISNLLCKNDEQKMLFKISKNLSVLEAFLNLRLAPEDFDYYKTNKRDFDIKDWKGFLKNHSKRFRLNVVIPEDTSAIDKNFNTLEAFYKAALKRDQAFLKNSLKKMEKEKTRIAVLIAGGFHMRNLTRLFRANRISYIVITPKFTQKTDYQLYDRMLRESYKTRIWKE